MTATRDRDAGMIPNSVMQHGGKAIPFIAGDIPKMIRATRRTAGRHGFQRAIAALAGVSVIP
ncbi:MAG: hypothetical protein WBP18_09230, partial [Paracoccaceae bacterium]